MTKSEAIVELAELEPKEAAAWQKIQELDAERKKRDAEWLPLIKRRDQLKNFIELAGDSTA